MRTVLALVVFLGIAERVHADDMAIIKKLEAAGVRISKCPDGTMSLDFDGVRGTDALLSDLCEVRSIGALIFLGSDVTDAGMSAVGRLKDLNYLDLNFTAVTDVGLRRLEGMKYLKTLALMRINPITPEGVSRLRKALPTCKIYY